jgi:methyl-accepting chemotaxis protein
MMIKRILQNMVALFTKIANVSGIIRLKVFYQLLIIIIVMIVFLGIQTYTSDRIISRMQKETQTIFIDSSYKSNQISRLKQDISKLETAYLEEITKEVSVDLATKIADRFIVFDWMDAASQKDISGKFESIQELLKEDPSVDNYRILRDTLFEMNLKIGKIESKLSATMVEGIANNNRFLNESRVVGIIIMVVSSLFSILLGLVIVNSITTPLKQVEEAAKSIAVGDLTQNVIADGSPEISRVVGGLNQAVHGLRELVSNINSQSEMLTQASMELKTASAGTGKSASEMARAMEDLAQGSTKQAEQISQATNTVQFLSEMVQHVSDETELIAAASKKVVDSARIGLKATADVADEIQGLYVSTKEIDGVINELSKATDQINEIISVIRGIAEQTTLLSLNASIEAARAGEHGKGFAVVAHETSKLAEQSKQAAGLIDDLIVNIKGRTDQAVHTMQKGMERAENGKNLAAQTSKTFEEITQSLNNNLSQIEAVTESTRKMAESNKDVIEKIMEIAAISEESLASTEEISATTEEQSTSTQEVTALADNLNQIAESLHQAVAVFELEAKKRRS